MDLRKETPDETYAKKAEPVLIGSKFGKGCFLIPLADLHQTANAYV